MKIFAFTDTHGLLDFGSYEAVASKADLLIHAGDLTEFSMQDISEVVGGLSLLAGSADADLVFVHGNHDWDVEEAQISAFERVHFVHASVRDFGDVVVLGYGGGGFSREDPVFEEFVESVYAENDFSGKVVVWVMHGPPYNLKVDERPGWPPTGCQSKRRMIDRFEPHLVVSGHIHEAFGVRHVHGRTALINPGVKGVLLDLTP